MAVTSRNSVYRNEHYKPRRHTVEMYASAVTHLYTYDLDL